MLYNKKNNNAIVNSTREYAPLLQVETHNYASLQNNAIVGAYGIRPVK